jgi:hypothetical protein
VRALPELVDAYINHLVLDAFGEILEQFMNEWDVFIFQWNLF